MSTQNLGNLLPDGQYRIERGHRLLENHRDIIATNFAEPGIAGLGQILTFKENMPACDTANIGG